MAGEIENPGTFNNLQQRLNRKNPSKEIINSVSTFIIAYDLLILDKIDLRSKNILENDVVHINCIRNYNIAVFTDMLHFKKSQTVRLRKKGILQINEQTIYNSSTERGDIIMNIRFV